MRQDLLYALRNMSRSPGFAGAAILSLALGIGLNSMIFTFFNAIFFHPLDVSDPARVTRVFTRFADSADLSLSSYPLFEDYRLRNSVYEGLAAYGSFTVNLSPSVANNTVRRAYLYAVSANFFGVLGLKPALGRGFQADEDRSPGTHPVAILSDSLWRTEFGADPAIIGRLVKVNNSVLEVIGVGPRDFLSLDLADQVDVYIPLMNVASVQPDAKILTCRDCGWLNMIGRLKPGVGLRAAEAGMQTLAAAIAAAHPEIVRQPYVRLAPATLVTPEEARNVLPVLALIFAAVGAILLLACGNVTSLLLARASGRRKEIALRVALGAGRFRLIRQLLTESLLLALIGGAASLLLVIWMQEIIRLVQPPGERTLAWHLSPDVRVLAFTTGLALMTGLIFGLAPALQGSRPDPIVSLRERSGGGSGRSPFRQILVAGQVALSLVLLISAGLLVRGIIRAQSIDPGFQTSGVLALPIELEKFGYDRPRASQAFHQIVERLRGITGMRAVALASASPLSGRRPLLDVLLDNEQPSVQRKPRKIGLAVVSQEYFETLRIPMIRGRAFTPSDSALAPKVAIVNRTMAQSLWTFETAAGKRFSVDGMAYTVVGVVPDTSAPRAAATARPEFFVPLTQSPQLNLTVLASAPLSPEPLLAAIRKELSSIDTQIQIYSAQTLDAQLEVALRDSRLGAVVAAGLGLLALALASIGLHGVISYSVSNRTQEIGIRMALGAKSGEVLLMIIRQGLVLCLAGAGCGLVVALVVSRLLTKFLYGVSAGDPVTYVAATLVLTSVAAMASYIPARRAACLDPIAALRCD